MVSEASVSIIVVSRNKAGMKSRMEGQMVSNVIEGVKKIDQKDPKDEIPINNTFTSMSSMRWAARIIGRPTTDGNVCWGKLEPA